MFCWCAESDKRLQNSKKQLQISYNFPFAVVFNFKSCTYMISRGAASSSPCASTVAVLTGAPLCGGGVWVLALACDCGDGTEHLRGHVAWEGIDSSCQV